MADHVRKQVRNAVEIALPVSMPTMTLLKSNAKNIDGSQLPAIRVIARREVILQEALAGWGIDREIELKIIVNDFDGDDLDDVMDAHGASVERAILNILDSSGIVEVAEYLGSEITLEGVGEQRSGAIELTFRVVVQTPEGDPTTVEN